MAYEWLVTSPEGGGRADSVFHRVDPRQHRAAGARVDFSLVTFSGMPDQYHIVLQWTNSDGPPGMWRSDVTPP